MVIHTAETGGSYVLGFRIDPPERLNEIYKELLSLHSIYTESPYFGLEYDKIEAKRRNAAAALSEKQSEAFKIEEFQEIDERQEKEINSKLNAYLAEGVTVQREGPRAPIYCKELGFAMERIRDGYTLKDLWDVLPAKLDIAE